jgi:hypothetical protein
LKRWKDAEEYFEICVTSPGSAPAALQMEALKKLRLVQLISTGQVSFPLLSSHPLSDAPGWLGFEPAKIYEYTTHTALQKYAVLEFHNSISQ